MTTGGTPRVRTSRLLHRWREAAPLSSLVPGSTLTPNLWTEAENDTREERGSSVFSYSQSERLCWRVAAHTMHQSHGKCGGTWKQTARHSHTREHMNTHVQFNRWLWDRGLSSSLSSAGCNLSSLSGCRWHLITAKVCGCLSQPTLYSVHTIYTVCAHRTPWVELYNHHQYKSICSFFFCTGVLRDLGPVSDLHNKSYFRLVEKNSQKKNKKITILMFIFVQITSVDYRCMWVACVSFDISEFKFELDDFDVEMYQ